MQYDSVAMTCTCCATHTHGDVTRISMSHALCTISKCYCNDSTLCHAACSLAELCQHRFWLRCQHCSACVNFTVSCCLSAPGRIRDSAAVATARSCIVLKQQGERCSRTCSMMCLL